MSKQTDNSRAVGLLGGIVLGLTMLGNRVSVDGTIAALSEVISLLNNELDAQECDATKADSSSGAGSQIT